MESITLSPIVERDFLVSSCDIVKNIPQILYFFSKFPFFLSFFSKLKWTAKGEEFNTTINGLLRERNLTLLYFLCRHVGQFYFVDTIS